MNIIFVGRRHGQSKQISLDSNKLVTAGLSVLATFLLVFVSGYFLGDSGSPTLVSGVSVLQKEAVDDWQQQLAEQKAEVLVVKERAQQQIDALTLRLGEMQARLLRLDALGQRLTSEARLEKSEFDFTARPAQGGPEDASLSESYSLPDLNDLLAQVESQINDREQQLELLNEFLVTRNIREQMVVAGSPITGGWLSSRYGYRSDPFSGRRAWHAGVDFAGKDGSDILAVASGVVTWSAERNGYGNLVELNHGDGITTRYGHCKEILVKTGEIVQKGQIIARMGSTGRSTGPHVHYEVLKEGKSLNPEKYINRASR
ncbi:MAG: peptidoglycan DD-metalloendopeptidase family protein [Hahellaceae bacterium]|nr:peptidoglycan DD-metalloendopeptidase family protein [Hahellaceae bacterium]MCP5169863.1 peptidoglycan DD-metalloendopeptidase family protein [Hahellaceae bacterium]